MNTTHSDKVLELIKQRPGIRAMQIGDLLDLDVADVHNALAALLQAGQITSARTPGPNGVMSLEYKVNSSFLGWKSPSNPNSPWRAVGKGVEEHKHAAAPKADQKPSGGPTKASLALDHLVKHGRATNAELKAAMRLEPKYSPSSFLGPLLKSGTIARDGDIWTFVGSGDQRDQDAAPQPSSVTAVREKSIPNREPRTKKQRPQKPAHIPQDAIASSMSIGGLQLIHWKAGNLVISANDNTVELSAAHTHALRAFVGLMP